MKKFSRIGRVITSLLEHPQGISGREIDFQYSMNSGRNEVSDLIKAGYHVAKRTEWQDDTHYTVYSIPNRQQALKLITRLNVERQKAGLGMLTQNETHQYLARFKDE